MIFDISKRRPGWSLSRIQGFTCPLRWARLNIERRGNEEVSGDAALIGRVVAGTMEVLRARYLKSESVIEFPEVAQKIAIEEKAGEENLEEAIKSLETGLTRIRDIFPKPDTVKWWAVEHRMSFDPSWVPQILSGDNWTLKSGEEAYFRIVPDFAYLDSSNVLHIHDDKALWGDPQLLQLKLYAFGLCVWLGWESSGRRLDFKPFIPYSIKARFNMMGKGCVEKEITWGFEDVADIPAEIDRLTAPILATRDFVPIVFKNHCEQRCGFIAECPKHQTVYKAIKQAAAPVPTFALPREITTQEEAEKLGVFLFCVKTILADGNNLMQSYVKANGTTEIPGTGKEYRFNPTTSWEAELGSVMAQFAEQGHDSEEIYKYLGISWARVEKAINKLTPLGGKGITKDVKMSNRSRRNDLVDILKGVGEEKSGRPKFGAFNQ